MDIAALGALLGNLKTAAELAKAIRDSGITLEKAEMKLQLAELISTIADAKVEASNLQQELLDRDTAIRALTEQLSVKAKLLWESPYYWQIDGDKKQGPYCQQCYDKDSVLVRLQGGGEGYWECKTCKNNYMEQRYRESLNRPINYGGHNPYA